MLIDFCAKGGKLSIDEAVIGMIATFYDFSLGMLGIWAIMLSLGMIHVMQYRLNLSIHAKIRNFWSNPASFACFWANGS